MSTPYEGDSNNPLIPGIKGINTGIGAIAGTVPIGVYESSTVGAGVYGDSQGSGNQHAGVSGINNGGTQANQGGPGVYGSSSNLDGVQGWSQSSLNAGVSARNTAGGYGVWANRPNGTAIYGQGQTAGNFQGNVEVTGTLSVTGGPTAGNFQADASAKGSVGVKATGYIGLDAIGGTAGVSAIGDMTGIFGNARNAGGTGVFGSGLPSPGAPSNGGSAYSDTVVPSALPAL